MIELLRYLEANGFTNYIASGGDRDFMRPVTEEIYGIPSERVIGSSNALAYTDDEHGGTVSYEATGDFFDDGLIKPVRIWSRIGRRPILAGGNSNGDIPMLRYAGGKDRPALRLLLLHDDDDREFAYTTGAENSLERPRAGLDGGQHQERLGHGLRIAIDAGIGRPQGHGRAVRAAASGWAATASIRRRRRCARCPWSASGHSPAPGS